MSWGPGATTLRNDSPRMSTLDGPAVADAPGAMLRITENRSVPEGRSTLVVEGRLAGPWVDELRTAAARHPKNLALDLAGLSYADADGVTLLKQLVAEGATVARATAYVSMLLGRSS